MHIYIYVYIYIYIYIFIHRSICVPRGPPGPGAAARPARPAENSASRGIPRMHTYTVCICVCVCIIYTYICIYIYIYIYIHDGWIPQRRRPRTRGIPHVRLICNRVDVHVSCVLLLLHASIDLPVIRFAQRNTARKAACGCVCVCVCWICALIVWHACECVPNIYIYIYIYIHMCLLFDTLCFS